MKKRELEDQIKQAYSHIDTPDVLQSVLSNCNVQVEEEYTMTKNKNQWFKGLVFVAVILLVVVGAFGFNSYKGYHAVASVISFDVNPSLEIKINKYDRVLEVNALNEDAKIIIADMDFKDSDLDVTVNALIGSMIRNGYLSDLSNSILISVDNHDAQKSAELQNKLIQEINEIISSSSFQGALLSQIVTENETVKELSETYGITPGKVQLIQSIMLVNPLYNFETLASLTINELNLLRSDQELKNVSVSGQASAKDYIGEAKAKEIALKDANVTESNIYELDIEIDYEMNTLSYEVEFKSENFEYNYDIHAKTGEILHSSKEKDDEQEPLLQQPLNQTSTNYLKESKIKEIALNHAGINADQICEYWAEMKNEDGIVVYDVEFNVGKTEYDFEIDAVSGRVLEYDKEVDDDKPHAYHGTNSQHGTHHGNGSQNGSSSSTITKAKAKEIALSKAELSASQISNYEIELDDENGTQVYEISFDSGNTEYDVEIDATSGSVIKFKKEIDD